MFLLSVHLMLYQEQSNDVKKALIEIAEKFEETLVELKKTCKAKTAVPVDQVYVRCLKNV